MIIWWVVEPPTPLKNDGLRQLGFDDIPNIYGKIIHSCSKPPTSISSVYQPWFIDINDDVKEYPIYAIYEMEHNPNQIDSWMM